MVRSLFFTFFLTLTLNGFGGIYELVIEYDEPTEKNYGSEVKFRFYEKNKKGKKSALNRNAKDDITFTVKNGDFEWSGEFSRDLTGTLRLATKPQSLNDTITTIEFSYTHKDQTQKLNYSFALNFRGKITLDYSGKNGENGKTYTSGVVGFIVSNKSNDGEPGTNGENGKDIEATMILKTKDTDTFYVMNVNDVSSGMYYIYKVKKDFSKISIVSNGGTGGNGGRGSDGSRNNRARVDGGDGGNGGNGGNAGKIIFYLDDRAWRIMPKIELMNNPGRGGQGGAPGDGEVLKDDPSVVGRRGTTGTSGMEGTKPNLAVPELKKLE